MDRRVAAYLLGHGTQQAWLVDPETRTVAIHAAGTLPRFLGGRDVLEGGDPLPGFSTPIAASSPGCPPRRVPNGA